MKLLAAFAARTAIMLVAGFLVPLQAAQGSTTAASETVIPPALAGSCQELAEREWAAYAARVKARDYSAAGDIARGMADRCLEAGDLKRARDWFLTARAVAPRSSKTTVEQDLPWRRRYEQGVARQRPPQTGVEAAEARADARRAPERHADPVIHPRATAPTADLGVAHAPQVPANQQFDSMHVSWITGAFGLAVFVLGGAVLVRRVRG